MKSNHRSALLFFIVQQSFNLSVKAAPQSFHFPIFPQPGQFDFLSQFSNQWSKFFPNFQPSHSNRFASQSQTQSDQNPQFQNPQDQNPQSSRQTSNSGSGRNSNANPSSVNSDQGASQSQQSNPATFNQGSASQPTTSSGTPSPNQPQPSQNPKPNSASPNVSSKATTPTSASANTCSVIQIRKEWRSMDRSQQKSYLSAVKCLMTKPSILDTSSNLRLYDDFESVHDRSRPMVHWTAQFLPCRSPISLSPLIHQWTHVFNFVFFLFSFFFFEFNPPPPKKRAQTFHSSIRTSSTAMWLQWCFTVSRSHAPNSGWFENSPWAFLMYSRRWDWSLDAANMTASPVWSPDPEVNSISRFYTWWLENNTWF